MPMFENEVEWFRSDAEDTQEVKSVIWEDEAFIAFVEKYGAEEALYRVSDFHKNLATQLKDSGVSSPEQSDWAKRTISLTIRAKRRRQMLRKAVRELYDDGDEIVARIAEEVEEDWA